MKGFETEHRLIFGDSADMHELEEKSVHLVVTSPPYFNAPFDYPDMFDDYDSYLAKMSAVAEEIKRVLVDGRVVCIVCDDILVRKKKYPVVADLTKIFIEKGFNYRDRITWIKPEGYIRISRRSGVLLQHPYPMYFYPDNIQESILIFQKGEFVYKTVSGKLKEESVIDVNKYQKEKWYLSIWSIVNVLPNKGRLEEGIAAFPEEIPYRLIKLFSYVRETVLDPFMGSATTNKVAAALGRNSIGYEIDAELADVVRKKMEMCDNLLFNCNHRVTMVIRDDARRLRTELQRKIGTVRSVTKNGSRKTRTSQRRRKNTSSGTA